MEIDGKNLAYIIGVAIGDGNLSNPNGRATRLRITCDAKYTALSKNIQFVKKQRNAVDISCYSKKWPGWLGWEACRGSKYDQKVSVPEWVLKEERFLIPCLKGLIETDGSIYYDRGYLMVNFVTTMPQLADNVLIMLRALKFKARIYTFKSQKKTKYTIRVSKNALALVQMLNLEKK